MMSHHVVDVLHCALKKGVNGFTKCQNKIYFIKKYRTYFLKNGINFIINNNLYMRIYIYFTFIILYLSFWFWFENKCN